MTSDERRLKTEGWISVQPDMFDAQRQSHWKKGDFELVLEDGLYILMDGTRVVDESEDVGMIIEASHAWKSAVRRV